MTIFTGHLDIFIGYGSEIHLVEAQKRQIKPRSANYRDAWELILQWAIQKKDCDRSHFSGKGNCILNATYGD
ncbi:hypothetical protein [Synechocystis sp. PCC 7509]|uniref:hypothetical protein n=1 Tax=Synechocystis sp. PCC 7509 TaxID=927677 RepID=UPI000A063808|nr:hypothetical protein [Synechocystis sp. PCC 7509]